MTDIPPARRRTSLDAGGADNADSESQSAGIKPTRALLRGLAVLETVAAQSNEATLAGITSELDLDKATVLRLLRTLVAADYLVTTPTGYRLGPRAFALGRAATAQSDFATVARPIMAALRASSSETIHLGILDNNMTEIVYIDKLESSESIRLVSAVGARMPVQTTALGKAMLSALKPAECETLIGRLEFARRGPNSIMDADALRTDLAESALRGYAVDNCENEASAICVASAITSVTGTLVGGISISGPAFRMADKLRTCGAECLAAAAKISALL
jgi:DNA-binding IclR family transcriptional regulator